MRVPSWYDSSLNVSRKVMIDKTAMKTAQARANIASKDHIHYNQDVAQE